LRKILPNKKKNIDYWEKLQNLNNKHVADFALFTPINSIQRFLVKYELMKLIKDIPGAVLELGVCSGNGLMSLIHCHNVLQPRLFNKLIYWKKKTVPRIKHTLLLI
jgi:hypothetical protein